MNKAAYLLKFTNRNHQNIQSITTALDVKQQTNKKNDSIFIRHAHSEFNKACQDYRIRHKIDYDWDALCNHPGFDNTVAFNPAYFDSPLTKKGIEQCYITRQKIHPKDFDIVIVSPHQRALETCNHIFNISHSKLNVPVIVEPLVAGSLWSSCDISKVLSEKQKEFPLFDFSRMQKHPQLWFIENLHPKHKKKIYTEIAKRKLTSFKEKQYLVLELMRNKEIMEDRYRLRERAWQIKKLMKCIKQKHCKMLIISHYYIIQYVNSRSFNQQDHTPTDDIDIQNSYPYYNNLDQLFNYK